MTQHRTFKHATLRALLLVVLSGAAPTAAHDLYLEPSAFLTHPGEWVALSIGVGHAFEGAPLPFSPERTQRFELQGHSGARQDISTVAGVHPAGFVRFPAGGTWSVLYEGAPWDQVMGPAAFRAYLAESDRMDLAMLLEAPQDEAPTPITEAVHRCARVVVDVKTERPNATQKFSPTLEQLCKLDLIPIEHNASTLRVRVLEDGRPLEAATVRVWGRRAPKIKSANKHPQPLLLLVSDARGEIEINLRQDALAQADLVFSLIRIEPPSEPAMAEGSWRSVWSTLALRTRGFQGRLDSGSGDS